MTKAPPQRRMALPIIMISLLSQLAPLPFFTEALAYMDTERSHKLDAPSCGPPTMSSPKFFTRPASARTTSSTIWAPVTVASSYRRQK